MGLQDGSVWSANRWRRVGSPCRQALIEDDLEAWVGVLNGVAEARPLEHEPGAFGCFAAGLWGRADTATQILGRQAGVRPGTPGQWSLAKPRLGLPERSSAPSCRVLSFAVGARGLGENRAVSQIGSQQPTSSGYTVGIIKKILNRLATFGRSGWGSIGSIFGFRAALFGGPVDPRCRPVFGRGKMAWQTTVLIDCP